MTSSQLNKPFSSLEELYAAFDKKLSLLNDAELILFLREWFLFTAIFDEKTGETVPDNLENFLSKISNFDKCDSGEDYVSRIIDHSNDALKFIFQNPREKILREHAVIPIYAVREVDSSSVQWLSKRSGRNIREKLAEKPYLKAVTRRFSLDTIENRLVKAFVYRLESLLVIKEDLKIDENGNSELLQLIERWLRDDMSKEIGNWSNFPPNNTLLQDKHYRKVWDSWLWIQNVDTLVTKDSENYKNNFLTLVLWNLIAELNRFHEMRFFQQPIYSDYDNFTIKTPKNVQGILYFKEKIHQILCEYKNNKVKVQLDHKLLFIGEIDNKNQLKVYMNGKTEYYDYTKDSILKVNNNFSALISKEFNVSKVTEIEKNKILGQRVVLEASSIYPEFIVEGEEKERIPFRFVTQYWKNEEEQVNIDCSTAKALLLSPEIMTISIKNLFSKKILDSGVIFTSALNKFTKDIANYLNADKLTYLVSDRTNEFESEKLRKSMNFSFNNAEAIPRSIASVFYWQSLENFKKHNILSGDVIIVIEATAESISMSKLVANKYDKLLKIIPDTMGISWERHPSVDLDTKISKNYFQKMLKTKLAKDITDIWGKKGLELDSENISWVSDNDEWFTGKKQYKLEKVFINIKEIQSKLNLGHKSNVQILLIGEYADQISIQESSSNIKYKIFELADKLLEGATQLNKWQEKIKGRKIALWKDHLPSLSFNIAKGGIYQNFYLVKDTTIIPMKGNKTNIIITQPFQLDKNKPYYEFPLKLGSGNQKQQFMASLRSAALPLDQDVICELIMTYTYGADDPYELYFVPKKEENLELFRSIKVEWKDLSERQKVDAPIPDFPNRYSWHDFEIFPKKNNDGDTNLLEWVERDIKKIISLDKFMSSSNIYNINNRVCIDISTANWKQAGNGDWFCRYTLYDNKEIFIHQDEYEKFDINYKEVSFNIKENRGGLIAKNITKGKSISGVENFVLNLRKSIRFPVITIWNQGHSLTELDSPDNFKKNMKVGIESAVSLLNNEKVDWEIKKELYYFLSLLHKDTPLEVSSYLISKSNENDIKGDENDKKIAYAIGDAIHVWQKELLSNSVKSSQRINILSIALWRSKSLITQLSIEEINMIINDILKLEMQYNNKNAIFKNTRKLEVLLALLRTRESKDNNISTIFKLDSKITNKFIKIIEKLTHSMFENNQTIKTRITFNLDKPKSLNKTPDLLYALRLYLTGEDGANTIQVTEVESE